MSKVVFSGLLNVECEFRRRANREVQTVNSEGGGEGAVETGVKRGLKKAHKP